jgi:hypothetical protein
LSELFVFPANFGIDVVENLPKGIETGIYYGFASVDNGEVHKMVMSIGWNPYYDNEHKSMVSESDSWRVDGGVRQLGFVRNSWGFVEFS